jgi:hypothetical protein
MRKGQVAISEARYWALLDIAAQHCCLVVAGAIKKKRMPEAQRLYDAQDYDYDLPE